MTALEEELAQHAVAQESYLTIGVFDGVHLGHRSLLELLRREAAAASCLPGVVTFCNHPREVLSPGTRIPVLLPLEERLRRLRDQGMKVVAGVTFTPEVSRLSAREFVGLLQRYLRMRGLVAGPDFALGHDREGTIAALTALGDELGFRVVVAPPYTQGDRRLSSSLVRSLVLEGDVRQAAQLLGRPFAVVGRVERGEGRG
ncbi:MAG: bifunctional riboflavin kinase/FAD synthetase, partial [Chloroflexi bacterium]|nr:bifunctional riboflavin kinase/FAD synthetase [Chloroflexota bacterium]